MNTDDLFEKTIKKWGTEAQLRQAQEECGELVVAINHFCRNRENSISELIGEVVDVSIMIEQLKKILKDYTPAINAEYDKKINRLKDRINK